MLIPSREEAEKLLSWAHAQNPGPWADHCSVVARAAEAIARKAGLDAERAYVSGLFHDVGYYSYRDGKGTTCHIYAGYQLMMGKGYDEIARICLTHSFPYQDIGAYSGTDMYCSNEELAEIAVFIAEAIYDDYDKLIQLCDCLGTAQGMCLMERRMLDVTRRHGFRDFTLTKWDSYFALKGYFDRKCGINLYSLFRDELNANIFGK